MEWNRGFTGSHYASEVDPGTWKDIDRFEITGGSIEFTDEGLRSSADIDCVNYENNRETWVRVWMDAKQTGDSAHIPLFTGLACAPDKDINGTLITNNVKCYSVLQPCESVLLPRGWFAPSGIDASIIITELLSITPAPVIIQEGMPRMAESIVAEENETHLSMIEKILVAIGWRMKLTGYGEIVIAPKADKELQVFSKDYDVIETQLSETYDWYSAPNVFRAVTEKRAVTIKDESDSILSVQNRGREIWAEETNVNLNNGESLEGYAERRLKEEQQAVRQISYTRRFIPDIYPTDNIRICYPQQDLDGVFCIVSQSISLGYGAPVDEEVKAI